MKLPDIRWSRVFNDRTHRLIGLFLIYGGVFVVFAAVYAARGFRAADRPPLFFLLAAISMFAALKVVVGHRPAKPKPLDLDQP